MHIGIPKENKPREGRIALLPQACSILTDEGHAVYVESGAGVMSGYSDADYERAGAQIVPDAAALYAAARLIVKVKEPIEQDLQYLRSDHTLFCFLHLAAFPELTRRLCDIGLTAVAFETVQTDDGSLPLLAPMSAIAGRVGAQVGTHLLHQSQGGRGILLGGIEGTEAGKVVVLGAGVAGTHAAMLTAAIGADVTVFDKAPERLETLSGLRLPGRLTGRLATPEAIAEAVAGADLLIGAVLIPGAAAPRVVTAEMVGSMQSGSVIVDISVDQGGCIATTRPTSYDDPTYLVDGVIHFTVANMPGAVPRTATQALSHAILPYVRRIATLPRLSDDPELERGVNVRAGKIVHPALT
ncbi:MAG TPA: alanine dehydrogenase [Gammaproteobacteria bacterium]